MVDRPDVVVIGAGAAGIFAAWRAAELGARVVLLEKTARIGTKILVSGGGKCNVAHDGPLEDVIRAFRPNEARFIRPACYRLTNRQIIELFEEHGLRVVTRPDGRVFPVDQTAKDVVSILRRTLSDAGVDVRLGHPVESILMEMGQVSGVRVGASRTVPRQSSASRFGAKALLAEVLGEGSVPSHDGYVLDCSVVVLACGGSSYPNSGTTGDGWIWAKALGHTIVPPRAALAPIYLESPDAELAGVAVRSCRLRARQGGKEIARWDGDLLFTHRGISGPCALGISRIVAERLSEGEISLEVDLLPERAPEETASLVPAWTQQFPRKQTSSFLGEILPERLVPVVLRSAQVEGGTVGSRLDRKSRNRLATTLRAWPIGQVRHVPLELGEVVAGGVSLDEVDPQSMRSLKCEGLYLCGEVLDIAGPVGGYNLQAAFATGSLAGERTASSRAPSPAVDGREPETGKTSDSGHKEH